MSPINNLIDQYYRHLAQSSNDYYQEAHPLHYVGTTRLAATATLIVELANASFEALRCILFLGGFAMKKGLHSVQLINHPSPKSLHTMDTHLPNGIDLSRSFIHFVSLMLGSVLTVIFGIISSPEIDYHYHIHIGLIEDKNQKKGAGTPPKKIPLHKGPSVLDVSYSEAKALQTNRTSGLKGTWSRVVSPRLYQVGCVLPECVSLVAMVAMTTFSGVMIPCKWGIQGILWAKPGSCTLTEMDRFFSKYDAWSAKENGKVLNESQVVLWELTKKTVAIAASILVTPLLGTVSPSWNHSLHSKVLGLVNEEVSSTPLPVDDGEEKEEDGVPPSDDNSAPPPPETGGTGATASTTTVPATDSAVNDNPTDGKADPLHPAQANYGTDDDQDGIEKGPILATEPALATDENKEKDNG